MAAGRMLECCCRSLWDRYLPAIGSAVDASAWVLTALAVFYLWLYEGAGAFPVWLHAADKMLDKLDDVVWLDMRNDLESGIFLAAAGAFQLLVVLGVSPSLAARAGIRLSVWWEEISTFNVDGIRWATLRELLGIEGLQVLEELGGSPPSPPKRNWPGG
ncbi:hypothetical protein Nepgr_032265 [Nepenthes gracilis]|uniref:Uncharacterized protein n=1 Tax=Nepenthes gracilis TaxID=150966 RepID=A0AAD3TKH9_NEPGR|nr:hypothetical protein Nepgr_032265 [Nepenthes gracilis]